MDEDTGLYNLRARWFEPLTGSFVSKDPAIGLTGESYSYASGNPLLFTDPLGLWSETAGNDLIVGAIDGVTWIPIASTIMNEMQPGSVNICSEIFATGNVAGGFVGLGKIKAGAAIASGAALSMPLTKPLAGIYKKLSKIYKGRKGKQEVNHIPTHAWNEITGDPHNFKTNARNRSSNGPSIIMDYDDHRSLNTTGNKNYAKEQLALGKTERDVVIQDIREIQDKFGNKYDEHIKEYIENFGHIFNINRGDFGL